MFALQAGGQVMQHQAQGAAVKGRNRAKLRNFEEQNRQYEREVMLNNNEWKNEVQVADIEQDQIYQAMVQQWGEQDQQLDKIFAQGDQKIEKAIVEMYENDYAGTQTGRTAGRLAAKSAKKLGQYKSEVLHNMMMAKDEAALQAEGTHMDAEARSRATYEKIRFSPVHGHTPMAPELEAKPGMGGLILGLAASGLGAAKAGGMFKAPDIGGGLGVADTSGMGSLNQITNSNIGSGMMPTGGMGGMTGFEAGTPLLNTQSIADPNMNWGDAGNPFQSGAQAHSLDYSSDFTFGNKL